MSYPEYANINGERYKINTDFRYGLRCFDVVNDETICDEERALAVVYILFGFLPEPELLELFLEKAKLFLQCGETFDEQSAKKPDMDFAFDRPYINASFMSDYRIDLNREKMHFWQFVELIRGLTENCSLSKLREIRNYDPADYKDPKARAKIIKAQQAVALPVRHTREELDAISEFENLMKGAGNGS